MKRDLYLAAILMPLAALVGWKSTASVPAGDKAISTQQEESVLPSAKSSTRAERSKRPFAPPRTWSGLGDR